MRHVVITTEEFSNPDYIANAPDRCYHCKTELYGQLDELAERLGVAVVVNGANADDLGDYRPGMRAASRACECGARWPNVASPKRRSANWRRIGNCRSPKSRRRPACPAASRTDRR